MAQLQKSEIQGFGQLLGRSEPRLLRLFAVGRQLKKGNGRNRGFAGAAISLILGDDPKLTL
jgi:hypothetical protein